MTGWPFLLVLTFLLAREDVERRARELVERHDAERVEEGERAEWKVVQAP